MSAPTDVVPIPASWARRHLHRLLVTMGVTMLVAVIAIQVLDRTACRAASGCDTLARLASASDAQSFEGAVWQTIPITPAAAPASSPGKLAADVVSIRPLREILFIDSVMLVPSYVGLLLLCIVMLHHITSPPSAKPPGKTVPVREWWMHLACLPAVIAGTFDIAENGMTARAAEDALDRMLADPTVADVHLATALKWAFLGLALLVIAFLSGRTALKGSLFCRGALHWFIAGAACSAAAGTCLLAVALFPSQALTSIGAGLFLLALVSVGTGLWRIVPTLSARPGVR